MKIHTIQNINNVKSSDFKYIENALNWDTIDDFKVGEIKTTLRNLNKTIANQNKDMDQIWDNGQVQNWEGNQNKFLKELNENIIILNMILIF